MTLYCTHDDCLTSLESFTSHQELESHKYMEHPIIKPWLYLLGAGASIDSGLPTYRGDGGINTSYTKMTTESSFNYLEKRIKENCPGETYKFIDEISPKNSMIITQNIDGYAHSTNLNVIDIHMHDGHELIYSNIVQIGQELPNKKIMQMNRYIKKEKPKYMIVIGTSMQFPYLRIIINKTKKFAKIIHINPDDSYKYNIGRNEHWIQDTAINGLKKLEQLIFTIEIGLK
jgi:NAD-dependent SIR2 family protein deacetylase